MIYRKEYNSDNKYLTQITNEKKNKEKPYPNIFNIILSGNHVRSGAVAVRERNEARRDTYDKTKV